MVFKISDLKVPGVRNIEITASVIELSEARDVMTRRGEQVKVATARIKDDSGELPLTLWNEQISQVKVGDNVKIEGGYTTSFNSEVQLNIGRPPAGKLTVI